MDLWDVAKVLWRRRVVTVPLLLLTVAAAVYSLLTIPPSYSARAQVAFLAPTVAQTANPFTEGRLAEYISISLNRLEVRRQLREEGLLDDYLVTFKPENLALIGLEVSGRQEETVARTVDRLIRTVQEEAAKLQANIPAEQAVTVSVADPGDDVATVRKAGRRALAIVAGVGLLATAGVALAIDSLVRRRSRPAAPPPRQLIPRQAAAMRLATLTPEDLTSSRAPAEPAQAAPAAKAAAAEPAEASDAGEAVTVLFDQNEPVVDNDVTIPLPLAGVSRPTNKPKGALAAAKGADTPGRGKKR